jgi:DNA-binding XRE family transcriptional regulator
MLTNDNIFISAAMPTNVNSATIGSLVRETRTAAGLTQTELANRIGASRFWVAEFEKGKPGAELGLALKAIAALGLVLRFEKKGAAEEVARPKAAQRKSGRVSLLDTVIARTTLTKAARSSIPGWPTASATTRRSGRR